jgi:integrase
MMKSRIRVIVALTLCIVPMAAQNLSPNEAKQIAERAYIYAYPLVVMEAIGAAMPLNHLTHVAKRRNAPDILDGEELVALLNVLPEPLRTGVELDAFTGLRRGALIGLQWQDVDFEKLVIHVRRSIVLMVEGPPKTEASRKDVPLDAALAESLLGLRGSSLSRTNRLVIRFAANEGRQPLWPESLWRQYGKPAVQKAGISKRVGWHTFRHSYKTLLKNNGEDTKVVRNSFVTEMPASRWVSMLKP